RENLLQRFYSRLKGAPLRVRVDRRLVKLESHQAEYLMLNYMISTLHGQLMAGARYNYRAPKQPRPAFQAQDFVDFFTGIGEQVIPEYRTARQYISGMLAKN